MGIVGVQFSLVPEDLRLLKLNTALATDEVNTYLSVTAGSNVRDRGNELQPLSFAMADQVDAFIADTTRPRLLENGFLSFNLNEGKFTVAFDEPMNSELGTPVSLFQHQATAVKSSDAFSLQSISCEAPECQNNETITFTLPREELNRIKLATRICSSGSTCWLTLPPPGDFLRDMSGNAVGELPNGDRSVTRLPLTFIDDTEGPVLESYTLNLTSRALTLSFNEPVEADTFNITGITLQSGRGVVGNAQVYRLTGGALLSETSRADIVVLLSDSDVNALQSRPNVASSMSTTYLVMEAVTARDLSYRQTQAQAITSNSALLVSVFESDRAPPQIRGFDLDLDSNSLTITFTEPVRVDGLNLDRLVIASSRAGGVTYNITGGTLHSISLAAASVVPFTLPDRDLTFLEVSRGIATGVSDTYLASEDGLAVDTNGLASLALPLSEAVQVSEFIEDTSPPNVVSFSLDMDEGEVGVVFNDVILGSTFDVGALTFQSAASRVPLVWHTLSRSSSSSSTSNGFEVLVNIGSSDLNRLKQIRNLTTGVGDSFLTATATVANDVNGIDVIAITDGNAIPVRQFTPDGSRPSLNGWTLDLNVGQVVLTFSETVDILTLQPPQVTLLASRNSADRLALTGYENLIPPDADYRFAIQLNEADSNAIKARLTLGTELSNSYLSITRSAIQDTSGNDVVEISSQSALRASAFVADASSPVLRSFTLEFDAMLLSLTFDETVNAASFNVTALTLVNRATAPDATYTLTDSSSSAADSAVIDVSISQRDLNAVKAIGSLAVSFSTTFLTATTYIVQDTTGNRLAPITADSALQVSLYTQDGVRPSLVAFTANMSSEQLLLTFSETVSTVVDPTQITLQSAVSNTVPGVVAVTLRGGVISRRDGTVIVVQLDEEDANRLKAVRTIATDEDNTYIWFTLSAVQDPSGNPVVAVAESNAFQASSVLADVVAPRLDSFTLDLDQQQLVLFFDETVDSGTFASTLITLQDAMSSPLQSVQLGSFSRTNSPDGTQLLVELSPTDFNAITATFPLATMDTNTFISLGEGVVRDTAGVASSEIPVDEALLIVSHTADLVRPSLAEFDFDLNSGVLTLEFTESVNITSFDATQITIQNEPSSPTSVHTLRGGVVTQRDNTIIDVSLTRNDLNDIKRQTQLASLRSDTYMSITSATVMDMNRNMIIAVSMSNAMLVRSYVEDVTGPVILGFDLDYDDGVVTLYLEETVDISTFQVGGVTLQSDDITIRHTLVDSAATTVGYETFIRVQLSSYDLNELKRLRICTSMSSCFLSAGDDVVRDIPLNRNAVILASSARAVGGFIPDLSRPVLVNYVEFDLDAGMLTLEFSETVAVSTINNTQITLDNAYTNATFRFGLEELSATGGDTVNVTFRIEANNINELKLNTDLCTHSGNCWIRFTDRFIEDASGNSVVEVLPDTIESYHQPRTFTPDVTPPVLLSYTIDLDSGMMTFTFDEVIHLGTFTPMNITFQNAEIATSMVNLREYGRFSRQLDGLVVEWNMTVPDLNLLKSYERIFSMTADSYLTHSSFIEDISGTGIGFRADALRVSGFVPDTTRPELQYFRAINFDNATLTLQFDEPVNISSINLSNGIAVAGNETFDLHIYDREYINDWYSLLFENGTLYNLTHTFEVGEYVLDCPFSLVPTSAPSATVSPTTQSPSFSGSGSGSGSGLNGTLGGMSVAEINVLAMRGETDEFYPLLLRGCEIFLNLSVEEPFYFLTGDSISYVDERKQQVQIALNRPDLRFLKLSFIIASNDSNTWIAFNATDILDMAENQVTPTNLFNATKLQSGRFVDDVTPPSFEFVVLDMDSAVLSLNFNDVMDFQSVHPLLVEISEFPGSNNTYFLQGPYPYPVPLTVDQRDDYSIDIPLSFDDMNFLKNNLDLATDVLNTHVTFPSDIATDIYGRYPEGVTNVQVQDLIPDQTGPVLVAFAVNYETRILNLTFDEVVNPNTFMFSGIIVQNSENSEDGLEFQAYTFTEGGVPLENDTGVSTLLLILDVDLNALIVTPDLGGTINDTYIILNISTVLDMNDNSNQRIVDGEAIQASEVVGDESPPFVAYYDLNLNDNLLVVKFSEAVVPATFNLSAIALQNTADSSEDALSISQRSNVVWREFNSLLIIRITESDEEAIKSPRSPLAKSADSTFLSIEREAAENYFGFRVQNISSSNALAVRQYFEGVLC